MKFMMKPLALLLAFEPIQRQIEALLARQIGALENNKSKVSLLFEESPYL